MNTRRIFPDWRRSSNFKHLELPFWMFQFDELTNIIFSGRQPHADERDALYKVMRTAKAKYLVELGSPTATRGAAPANVRRGFGHR